MRTTITDGIDHLRDLATDECNNKQNQTTTDESTSDTSTSDTTPSTSESTQSSDTSTSDSTQNTDTTDSTQSTQSTDTSPPSTGTNTDTGGGGVTPPTTPPTHAADDAMSTPTEVAGRYRLERRLGAGGMSTVFLATDAVLERAVAVKLLAEHLAEDEDFVARFRREALAAARLQHPNIVQVFDSGEDRESDRHYIVMEYVDGPSCAEVLREKRRLEVSETVHVLIDACHGLEYAHRAGVDPPRHQAGQPAPDDGRDPEAGRLRHREGGRADAHHAGRVGARHRRVPVARAGRGRGGRAGSRTCTRSASAPTSS